MERDLHDDADLQRVLAVRVDRGDFTTVEAAKADFLARLDQSIAQADAGQLLDLDNVFDELEQRYANWPRAAE